METLQSFSECMQLMEAIRMFCDRRGSLDTLFTHLPGGNGLESGLKFQGADAQREEKTVVLL